MHENVKLVREHWEALGKYHMQSQVWSGAYSRVSCSLEYFRDWKQ